MFPLYVQLFAVDEVMYTSVVRNGTLEDITVVIILPFSY